MMENLICYCFGYTETDIIKDLKQNNGTSAIMERILNEKRNGTCQCDINHPAGRWCISDVRRVVDKVKAGLIN